MKAVKVTYTVKPEYVDQNKANPAPSLWDRAILALGSVGRVAQGRQAWHDSTASPSIQNRLGIHHRNYELEYLVSAGEQKPEAAAA